MSWHPYDRKRRLWTIYWGERSPLNGENNDSNIVEFELTEPYSLYRDVWRDLQLNVLTRLVPPDYTVNVSQLWSRLWPQDGPLRFSKIHDIYKLPILLSSAIDEQEQPGKRKDFYWVMSQFKLDRERLEDLVFFQGVDLENLTWITDKPIEPWPTQLFEYNRAAYAWNSKLLKTSDFDQIIRRECWALAVTHLGSLDFMTTRDRVDPQNIINIIMEEAARFELEVEITPFDQRPAKPGFFKSLIAVPGNLWQDSWGALKGRNKRPS